LREPFELVAKQGRPRSLRKDLRGKGRVQNYGARLSEKIPSADIGERAERRGD